MGDTPVIAFVLLISTIILWFGIDAYLEFKEGDEFTISWAIAYGSKKYPVIVAALCLFLGIVMGHLWWPNFAYCQ